MTDFTNLIYSFLIAIFVFLSGTLLKPWLEKNVVYRHILKPLDIYPKQFGISGKRNLNLNQNRAIPIKESFIIVNKSNETIIIKDIDFFNRLIDIDKGAIDWLFAISDNETKLIKFINSNREMINNEDNILDKKDPIYFGGTTDYLMPIPLEPNKSIKIYAYIEPLITTKIIPNKINSEIKLIIFTSKKREEIKFGNCEWKPLS